MQPNIHIRLSTPENKKNFGTQIMYLIFSLFFLDKDWQSRFEKWFDSKAYLFLQCMASSTIVPQRPISWRFSLRYDNLWSMIYGGWNIFKKIGWTIKMMFGLVLVRGENFL
jgi:hypothetical protein